MKNWMEETKNLSVGLQNVDCQNPIIIQELARGGFSNKFIEQMNAVEEVLPNLP